MAAQIDFVDTHIHMWDLATGWYPGLVTDGGVEVDSHGVGDFSKIQNRNFLLDDYFALAKSASNVNVTKIVHVTAAQAPPTFPHETRFHQEMFEQRGLPNAVVGWTDFTRPVAEVDRELGEHSESPIFRGVRHHDGIDYTSDHTAACFEVMQRRGLIYDAVAHEDNLPDAAALAKRFDSMSFVLEHTGWPTRADGETFKLWRAGIEQFAASDNTAVKISGLGMVMHNWTLEDFRPWVEATIEVFGTDRCMFATNFPVDWLYSEYDVLLNAFIELTKSFSDAERRALFATNAERWYRI